MHMINVGHPSHLTTDMTEVEVVRDPPATISDNAAVTIASWYQSPNVADMPFTALSTTGSVGASELLMAIRREANQANGQMELRALIALAQWVHETSMTAIHNVLNGNDQS